VLIGEVLQMIFRHTAMQITRFIFVNLSFEELCIYEFDARGVTRVFGEMSKFQKKCFSHSQGSQY